MSEHRLQGWGWGILAWGAPQMTPGGEAHGGQGGSCVLAPVLALGREKRLGRKETLALPTRLSSPFPHRSVVRAPRPSLGHGDGHTAGAQWKAGWSAGRGPLPHSWRARTATELRALGAVATAVRGLLVPP